MMISEIIEALEGAVDCELNLLINCHDAATLLEYIRELESAWDDPRDVW